MKFYFCFSTSLKFSKYCHHTRKRPFAALHFGRFLKFSDFSKGSPLWNNDNKSSLNVIKFWEVSGNQKTNKFWKLQLSISCRTQKSARSSYLGPRWSNLFVKKIRSFRIREKHVMNSLLGLKALLANRTEIKWEKVKEEPVSPISLKTYSI